MQSYKAQGVHLAPLTVKTTIGWQIFLKGGGDYLGAGGGIRTPTPLRETDLESQIADSLEPNEHGGSRLSDSGGDTWPVSVAYEASGALYPLRERKGKVAPSDARQELAHAQQKLLRLLDEREVSGCCQGHELSPDRVT